jgi:hypothetical protein
MARKKTQHFAAPRIADYCDLTQKEEWFPVETVKAWFEDDALDSDDPKPSQSAYEKFADDVRRAVNRVSNSEKQRAGRTDLKTSNQTSGFKRKWRPFWTLRIAS